jgi:hypothetical protein
MYYPNREPPCGPTTVFHLLTNAGGKMANMWGPRLVGLAMSLLVAAPFIEPALGPVVGGFIAEKGRLEVGGGISSYLYRGVEVAGDGCHSRDICASLVDEENTEAISDNIQGLQEQFEIEKGPESPIKFSRRQWEDFGCCSSSSRLCCFLQLT